MSDEYIPRYQSVSHEQLYQGVQAGDAEQVETLASLWSSMKDTAAELGRSLRADLTALGRTWDSESGDEFRRRVGLVVQYSGSLAKGMGSVQQGLSLMAGPLRSAQRKAESPEETDDHDKAIKGGLKGALLGPGGAIIGALAGHQQDKAEQEKAHQRMVKVVAELAASYDVASFDRWVPPEPPPPDTPGGVGEPGYTPRSGPAVGAPSGAPGTGTAGAGAPGTGTAGAGTPGGGGPNNGGNSTVHLVGGQADGPTTGLAGSGSSTGTGALLTGWAAGAGGMVASTVGGTRTPGATGGASWTSTVVPAGGVVGAGALASGAGAGGSAPAARPMGGGTGLEARSAVAGSRVDAGRAGVAGRSAGGSASGMRPGVLGGAPTGSGDDDNSATRSTWLTEDDMDWQGGVQAAPLVLGADDGP